MSGVKIPFVLHVIAWSHYVFAVSLIKSKAEVRQS